MANIGHFDATQVAPSDDIGAIPAGEYNAQIIDSDLKPTSKNDGHYLELIFQVADGEFKNRKVWANLNLDNPNPKAVEIAQRELSAICHAVGKLKIDGSQELHYRPMVIRVDFIPAGTTEKSGYVTRRDKNEIKAYKALSGGNQVDPAPAPQPQAAPSPIPASNGAPPWAQKSAVA